MTNYRDIIQKISDRYNPDRERLVESRMFSDLNSWDNDVVKYVRLAMNEVDSSFTQRVLNAGNAVKNALASRQTNVEYEFQGSVMTQTHIRAASDIDLLTISAKFSNTEIDRVRKELQPPVQCSYSEMASLQRYSDSFSLYTGNFLQDLKELRAENERILTSQYTYVDITRPKSIKVHPTQYGVDVDVVVAAWFDSFDFVRHGQDKIYRGIGIYNKEKDYRENPSFPFLSIYRINKRSADTQGRLKKMIRFLKNIKEDLGNNINLTSFEINAICYDIPVSKYQNSTYLDLVYILWDKLYDIANNRFTAMQIKSVDGTEFVFIKNPDRYESVGKLKDLVWSIYQQLR